MRKSVAFLVPLMVLMPTFESLAAQDAPAVQAAAPHFVQKSMNVYRRFAPDQRAKMVDFYDKVLALKPLQPITLAPGQQMILFGVGSGQIKLASGRKGGGRYHP